MNSRHRRDSTEKQPYMIVNGDSLPDDRTVKQRPEEWIQWLHPRDQGHKKRGEWLSSRMVANQNSMRRLARFNSISFSEHWKRDWG